MNTGLFRLSNKLKRLSPEEPRDQPEVIGRTQGLKVIVRSSSFSAVKFCYMFCLKQSFLVDPSTHRMNESINKKAYSDESMFSRDTTR